MSETAVLLKVIILSTILSRHNLHDIHNVNEFNDNVNGIYDIKECCSGLKYSSFTGKKSFNVFIGKYASPRYLTNLIN